MVTSPAHGVFRVILIATVVVWAVTELRQAVKRRPEASRSAWGDELVLRVAAVAGALLAVAARASGAGGGYIEPRALAAWLGLAFLWCGIALRMWCFHTLGRYFTLTVRTSSDQPVISSGPYQWLRHPSYTGILLVVTGLGFFVGNWLSVVALDACVAAGLLYRIRVEERALLRDLGDRYRDYATTHKRLIPYVW